MRARGAGMQPEPPYISAKIFDGFAPFLAERGVDLASLLDALDIDPQSFLNLNFDMHLSQVAALLELAAQEANDPCLGLHWAEAFTPGATGAFGYLLLNAGTLREAMQAVAHYLNLVVHPAKVSFEEEADQGALRWYLSSLTTTSTTQYVSFSVAATVLRLRAVAGPSWIPLAVELTPRELPCTETVRRIFGPNVYFSSRINAVCADRQSLDIKSATSDRRLFDLIGQLGEHLLDQRPSRADIVTQCQKSIVNRLRDGEATLEKAALDLDLPARALQSKLALEDTTFEALLQDTRKDLAIGYLRESDLTLTDIALLLGFSELSAFSRATQRWFGMSPRAYRQELRKIATKSLDA